MVGPCLFRGWMDRQAGGRANPRVRSQMLPLPPWHPRGHHRLTCSSLSPCRSLGTSPVGWPPLATWLLLGCLPAAPKGQPTALPVTTSPVILHRAVGFMMRHRAQRT